VPLSNAALVPDSDRPLLVCPELTVNPIPTALPGVAYAAVPRPAAQHHETAPATNEMPERLPIGDAPPPCLVRAAGNNPPPHGLQDASGDHVTLRQHNGRDSAAAH